MRLTFGIVISAALAFGAPAFAHHSFSMFDNEKIVKLDGTVKELEWTNPHSWLRVMVDDPVTHQAKQWSIELASTGQQARIGTALEQVGQRVQRCRRVEGAAAGRMDPVAVHDAAQGGDRRLGVQRRRRQRDIRSPASRIGR